MTYLAMKLRTQFVLWTASLILVILFVGESFRQYMTQQDLDHLSDHMLQSLESSTLQNLNNLQHSLNVGLIDAMEEGDMDRLERLIDTQKAVEGLEESSIYGSTQTILYTTNPERLGTAIEPALAPSLYTRGERKPVRLRVDSRSFNPS